MPRYYWYDSTVLSKVLRVQSPRHTCSLPKTVLKYGQIIVLSYGRTKGKKKKIGTADRTPRETLEKRLEKTPSNARCFAHSSSLMCWSILESLIGTAHGAEELGLCPHGLACQAGAWGLYIRFCLGYGHICPKSNLKIFGKNILQSP
jgi:hypothetical protein